MSIRLRVVDGVLVAICAARSMPKDGDIYLDDAAHHALSSKFAEDFSSEGYDTNYSFDEAKLRQREESNNPARTWWNSVYGGLVSKDGGDTFDTP